MKKQLLKPTALLVSSIMLTSFFTGCGSKQSQSTTTASSTTAAPVKITWLSLDHGRIIKDDDPVKAEIEKKTNTKIELQLMNSGTELKNKINLLIASDSLPDMVKLDNAYDIFGYAPQGAFMELNALIDKFGTNIKKQRPQAAFDVIALNGKYYGIPNQNTMGKYTLSIRQDWLDNLGLKMPATTDELYNVLKKFATDDPDKDGQNNTIPFGTDGTASFINIFGAFGMQPDHYYIKDNKVYYAGISDEYKQSIAYIKKLYDDNLIDPDFFITKPDQALLKLAKGKVGSFDSWWSISPNLIINNKMNQTVPGVKWGFVKDLKGPDGKSGIPSQNKVTSMNCISAKSKNAEACVKVIDYLFSDEGTMLGTLGLKDVYYSVDANGQFDKYLDAGTKAQADKTLGLFGQLVLNPTLNDVVNKKVNPANKEGIEVAASAKLYSSAFEGLNVPEQNTYGADLAKLKSDWFIKFVTGKEPLSKWDEYVKQYNDKGGKALLDALTKEYNKIKGANISAAN